MSFLCARNGHSPGPGDTGRGVLTSVGLAVGGLAAGAVVAAFVARAEVARAVIGVVECPLLAGQDQLSAACALDLAPLDPRLPPAPQVVVCPVVAALLSCAASAFVGGGVGGAAAAFREFGAARLRAYVEPGHCPPPVPRTPDRSLCFGRSACVFLDGDRAPEILLPLEIFADADLCVNYGCGASPRGGSPFLEVAGSVGVGQGDQANCGAGVWGVWGVAAEAAAGVAEFGAVVALQDTAVPVGFERGV